MTAHQHRMEMAGRASKQGRWAQASRPGLLQGARGQISGSTRHVKARQTDPCFLVHDLLPEVHEQTRTLLAELTQPHLKHELDISGLRTSPNIRPKLENAIRVMQEGLAERDTEVRLLLLAVMCEEHILFIGPPGTAKSEVARRLANLVSGSYFERLLTRFSTPEELFGPLSMHALEEDKYERLTRGYLPEAEVAFIDEIFKANSAILNTLLTLIHEREFDNGSARVDVPLLTMVAASNELPESEELDALYDRFLIRRAVQQVSTEGVIGMLEACSPPPQQTGNPTITSKGGGLDLNAGNGIGGSSVSGSMANNNSSHSNCHNSNITHTIDNSSCTSISTSSGHAPLQGSTAADHQFPDINHNTSSNSHADHRSPDSNSYSGTDDRTRGAATGRAPDSPSIMTAVPGSIAAEMRLSQEDIRTCRQRALAHVLVPQPVIDMLINLRTHLQEKIEPPIFVSDRRLVKSLQLLKVAAYCDGRDRVSEYDMLLLQHVLWLKPAQARHIEDWLEERLLESKGGLCVDSKLTEVRSLLLSLLAVLNRRSRTSSKTRQVKPLIKKLEVIQDLLAESVRSLSSQEGFDELQGNLWLGEELSQALITRLEGSVPRAMSAIKALLTEVTGLKVALSQDQQQWGDPVALAVALNNLIYVRARQAEWRPHLPESTSAFSLSP